MQLTLALLLALTAQEVPSVTLGWAACPCPVLGYRLYRSLTSGTYSTPLTGLLSGTEYTDSNLERGRTYYYVATSIALNGAESARSNEIVHRVPAVIDTCLLNPLLLRVRRWPSGNLGSRRLDYTVSVSGATATQASLSLFFGPPIRAVATDSRGCTAEVFK